MKNLIPGTITAFVLASVSFGLAPQSAFAETINGMIQKGGANCKMKAVDQFSVPMSDVSVSLGETFKESIDKGDIDLKDIKKNGLLPGMAKKLKGIAILTGKERSLSLSSNFLLF